MSSRTVLWLLIAVAVVVNVAGYFGNLYQRLWWFDEVIHAYTTFVVVCMVELLLNGVVLVGAERRPLLFVLTLAAIGLGLGALWEIGEWVFDLVAAGDIIKGKQDTMIDLVVDTFGAIAAGVLVLQLRKGQWNSPLTTVSPHEGSTSSSTH